MIIGDFSERIRFKVLLIVIVLWTTFVYVPSEHLFFQAEGGIRYYKVTGVQTCALPISFLGVPIRSRGDVFGNLYLTEKIDSKEFDGEDEAITVLLAAHAAVAVENARLHDESQRLVGKVKAMQRQRDLFSAMMNHELRNALTGVYGWAERLVRGKSPEQHARAAREVYEGAERTITLLNNFLDLTRLDAGKVRPVWHDVDIAAAVERAMAGVEPAAETKRVRLVTEYVNGAVTLRTDPVRLEQILVNLLTNAVRHSPEGETVAVQVAQNSSDVRFRVVDHGPGDRKSV